LAAAALGLVAIPAQAHDGSCFTVYENITGAQSFSPLVTPGMEAFDDVHTAVSGTTVLCAVDVRGRPIGAGTLSVSVYANNGDGVAPGALLAGPVSLVFPAGLGSSAVYHFEFPMVPVGQDLWIGQRWAGVDGWAANPRTTPTLGTSHDTWYFTTPSGNYFDDNGTSEASLYLVVYGAASVPATPSTWGALKSVYR
jgi:hypothetical protein